MRELAALSFSAEALGRAGYGLFLLLQLAMTIPNARLFFCSERYGGYVESTPFNDRWHRPATVYVAIALWALAAIGIMFGFAIFWAALINFALARYFYIHTRWKSILRGLGAPGHMTHWLAVFMLFLATAETFDPSGVLRPLAVLAFRIDFAAIMIAAGIYKLAAGYARGDGFERGLVNPWWGFFASQLRTVPAHSPAFRALNHAGYLGEILCGIAFLIPPAAPYAAIFLGTSFLIIGALIRLTFLSEMVAVCCIFMIGPGNAVDALIERVIHVAQRSSVPPTTLGTLLCSVLAVLLALYLLALPFAYAGMMVNFYGKRRLSPHLQAVLDSWTGFFGLILWRVFTADVINFFASISIRSAGAEEVSYLAPWSFSRNFRYRHVGEFICLASIFTTLKYYPHDSELFQRRIVRYARSINNSSGSVIVFQYFSIDKGPATFAFRPVARFVVDPNLGSVEEDLQDPTFDPRAPEKRSPVISGTTPGSYAPVAR
jgi:hypothetical protein